MAVRPSTLFAALLLLLLGCGLAMGIAGPVVSGDLHRQRLESMAKAVERLELTDLCLFTEASYTRHLTQADIHTAFQDHPMAMEHFPSGSLTMPPAVRFNRKAPGEIAETDD